MNARWVGPRERYTIEGPETFSDSDLLALVLGTGAGGRSAQAIARELLERFGGLAGLANAPVEAITHTSGVGMARAVRLHAACSLTRRARGGPPPLIQSPEDAWGYLRPRMEDLQHEELHALYLDRRGRVKAARRVTSGSSDFTIVQPRQVLRPAVAMGCPMVVMAHNHPSGDPEPSDADRLCTRRVAAAAQVLGIIVVDHLVVGDGCFVSLAERGELPQWRSGAPSITG